jgi:pheromone shutdown protein TraB
MQVEIYNTDYTRFIQLLGTAHFTLWSVNEASEVVEKSKTKDIAIELDPKRFNIISRICNLCRRRDSCHLKCEFIVASEALGNTNANIWLVDMSEKEMKNRIHMLAKFWISWDQLPILYRDENIPWLWEQGYKEETIQRSNKNLGRLKKYAPPIWRVLIEERNALMAARLASISSNKLEKKENPNLLALLGAAHIKGIKNLLQNPKSIKMALKKLNLTYTPPTLIKRIKVGS